MLWFVKERENHCDIELLIGVYASEHDAQLVIERVRDRPGFAIFPKDFKSTATKLGELVGRTATSKLANHRPSRSTDWARRRSFVARGAPLDDGQKRFRRQDCRARRED